MCSVAQIMTMARKREERQKLQKNHVSVSFRRSQSYYTAHPPNRVPSNTIPDDSIRFQGHVTHSWRYRPAGSCELTAQQRPEEWTSRTFSSFGRSLYRLNHLKHAQNIYRKRALWARCSIDSDGTRDRPQRAVLRGGDDTTGHTSAMDWRHKRTSGPGAASPSHLNTSRGTI